MMKRLVLPLFLMSLMGCGSEKKEVIGEVELIDKTQLTEVMSNDILLVDVRTSSEYNQGFIKGAVNIDYTQSDFEKRMAHFDRKIPVAVYCGRGGRSAGAAKKLQEMGFVKVYDLDGGYTE
ncbi:MAG: rhodanese-like domain-containing protein [Bacteroidota bacterium]